MLNPFRKVFKNYMFNFSTLNQLNNYERIVKQTVLKVTLTYTYI